MRTLRIRLCCLFLVSLLPQLWAETYTKPRVINTTDLGADPDDEQSMVRQLVSANEFDIEGLIVSTGCWKVGARVGVDAVLEMLSLRNHSESHERLSGVRIHAPLTASAEALLMNLDTTNARPLEHATSVQQAEASHESVTYFVPASDGTAHFVAANQLLSGLRVTAPPRSLEPITIDFEITSSEPTFLLATADSVSASVLELYQADGDSLTLLSSNQRWASHPSASLSSIFMNRKDLAGAELTEDQLALPLSLAAGTYQLQLQASSDRDTAAKLSLETVTAD